MYPYIKPVMGRAIINLLIAIPLGLLDGVVALSLKPYLDLVINGNPEQVYTIMGHTFHVQAAFAAIIPFGIIGFALFQGVLKYVSNYLTDWTGQKVSNSLKIDLFKKLTRLDPQFYDVNSSGLVLTRFLSDPDTASKSIIESLKSFIATFFGLIGLVGVLLYNSWQLAIIGCLIMGIAVTPVIFIRKRIKKVSNASMVVGGNMTTNFNETFAGNKIMAAYNLQDNQNKKFESQIHEQFNLAMSLTKRVGWMSPIMYFVCSIGIALVMAVGNHLILSGQMTAGSFASFVTSLLLLYKPTKTLGNTLTSLQGTFVAMGRVFELFDLQPHIQSAPDAIKAHGLNDSIEFRNVYFEYEKGLPVLKNFNLKVKKNETIALVGNSGGGKSTVVSLIPRFYDVTSGSVNFDGIDIRRFELNSLRDQISFVFQDNFLFSGSIRYNIMMGNENASEEALDRVVKMAHLDEFIATLENGLDTVVGERGTTLSGGQRQRVAIARAMLKDAPIVILDEATSALDNESEAIVQKALDNLIQNKTVFVIAHRLSTIKNADRIAVINEGELAELGTHDDLMNINDGIYRKLYEMQFKHQEESAEV
ncbi:ABC transporter ATP-binding protein [Spirochaetes bacterium]|uniref:ABC transporter ATP-binding protein n=1 Tax=Candidatus Scatousia excrementipullorum TaxID=2840936 RepID=A0A9D9H073_9BACT|nr:ABC transporter ATP-binding protein [Candidatus Scatousia excrementipullorum]